MIDSTLMQMSQPQQAPVQPTAQPSEPWYKTLFAINPQETGAQNLVHVIKDSPVARFFGAGRYSDQLETTRMNQVIAQQEEQRRQQLGALALLMKSKNENNNQLTPYQQGTLDVAKGNLDVRNRELALAEAYKTYQMNQVKEGKPVLPFTDFLKSYTEANQFEPNFDIQAAPAEYLKMLQSLQGILGQQQQQVAPSITPQQTPTQNVVDWSQLKKVKSK